MIKFCCENHIKILGLRWKPSGDLFKYKNKLHGKRTATTKCQMLLKIAIHLTRWA